MSPRDQVLMDSPSKHSNESTPLTVNHHISFNQNDDDDGDYHGNNKTRLLRNKLVKIGLIVSVTAIIVWIGTSHYYSTKLQQQTTSSTAGRVINYPTGAYNLVERQVGETFFDAYEFWDGPDSIGSAGFNTYIGKHCATQLGLVNVTTDPTTSEQYIFMSSAATVDGPRESIRIEGKKRYDHGLFIVDLLHMPAGCGQWPAFWLTDDDDGQWPSHGEIDIVEGINYQSVAKTALHTSESCSMWQQVAPYAKTGYWDRAEGLFDRYTGIPQNDSILPADNCYVKAPHQWGNQGCVAISDTNNTIGVGFNEQQGGIYVLEWDPYNGYIRSWVFPRSEGIPTNLQASIDTSLTVGSKKENNDDATTIPDPNDASWGLPYAYFAIGNHSDCSADHFQNMRIIFNLAFCGTVAGNRFYTDCPAIGQRYNTNPNLQYNPVAACNQYIQSNPDELNEAYWKIKGVYVYQRT